MEFEQEAVMLGEPAVESVMELLPRGLQPPVAQRRQFAGIANALDDRLDHAPTVDAHDVADHRIQADVGLGQRLLDALDVAGLIAHELLARPRQRAQLVELFVGHEARPDQPVGRQVRDPHRIVHVGLAAPGPP